MTFAQSKAFADAAPSSLSKSEFLQLYRNAEVKFQDILIIASTLQVLRLTVKP